MTHEVVLKFQENAYETVFLMKRTVSIYFLQIIQDGILTCETERTNDDFYKLKKVLEDSYSAQLIPPTPEKNINTKIENQIQIIAELKLFLKIILDHPIVCLDENLKNFLSIEQKFNATLPRGPTAHSSLPTKWTSFSAIWRIPFEKLILPKGCPIKREYKRLKSFKVKLETVKKSLEQLQFHQKELKISTRATVSSLKHLLFISKSDEFHAADADAALEIFQGYSYLDNDEDGSTLQSQELIDIIEYLIKYANSTTLLYEKFTRFHSYLSIKRKESHVLSKELEEAIELKETKPSFDGIYLMKIKHESMSDEMAVLEINYEKYTESVLKEFHYVKGEIKKIFEGALLQYQI